jgi:hypothetical protein
MPKYCYVREVLHFSERGPYKVVHVSKKGTVTFEKEDGECYYRDKAECRIVSSRRK